jgi:hypothetical protein
MNTTTPRTIMQRSGQGPLLREELLKELRTLSSFLSSTHLTDDSQSLVWIFGGRNDRDLTLDIEQVFQVYPEGTHAITLVLPQNYQYPLSKVTHNAKHIVLIKNLAFFELINQLTSNFTQKVEGITYLFLRKTFFVSRGVVQKYAREARHDYELKNLRMESIPRGIVHPLERSSVNDENLQYGGVTDANLAFVYLSATSRVHGQSHDKAGEFFREWYVGANPKLRAEDIPYIDIDVIFIGAIHKHYGHFILEGLSRLWPFLDKANKKYMAAYISSPGHDPFNNAFELFGIAPEHLIKIERPTQFRSVIVPEMSIRLHDAYHVNYKLTIEKIMESIHPATYDKVYFTRSTRLNRSLGEDAVIRVFQDNGYKVFYPENMPIKEQFSVLKGCISFAASSASNAHNAIFLKDGAEVICLNRSPHPHYIQTMIEKMKGLRTFYVDSYAGFLPVCWSAGPFLFGPHKCLVDFLNYKIFQYDAKTLIHSVDGYLYQYLTTWAYHYGDKHHQESIDTSENDVNLDKLTTIINETLHRH